MGIPIKTEYNWGKGAYFYVMLEKVDGGSGQIVETFDRAKITMSTAKHEAVFAWTETSTSVVSTDSHASLFLQRTRMSTVNQRLEVCVCVCVCVGVCGCMWQGC